MTEGPLPEVPGFRAGIPPLPGASPICEHANQLPAIEMELAALARVHGEYPADDEVARLPAIISC